MDSTAIIIATAPSLITVAGTIAVALISKNTNKKVETIKELKEETLEEVRKNREEYQKEINEHILENDKTYLTDFLADVEAGEPKSETQIRRAYEIKEDYNKRGGDSYVDDKWEEAIKKDLLKRRVK